MHFLSTLLLLLTTLLYLQAAYLSDEAALDSTASEKYRRMMRRLLRPVRAPWEGASAGFYSALETLFLFAESMQPTFEHESDWLPHGRKKLIHSQGAIASVEWRVVPNREPFTGIFATGTPFGLIRASLAASPSPESKTSIITPGIALKLFRSGVHSANVMAMYSLDGQPSWNFFENSFMNHVAAPQGRMLKLLAKKFHRGSRHETKLGLSDMAKYHVNGSHVHRPIFPYRLEFVPNLDIRHSIQNALQSGPSPWTISNWFRQLTGDGQPHSPQHVPPQSRLYSILAYRDPTDLQPVTIGELILNDGDRGFFASELADRHLFFQHTRMEDDYALRPDWVQTELAMLRQQADELDQPFQCGPFCV